MDQNLLSGLSDMGLGKLEGLDIYDSSDQDGKNSKNGSADKEPVVKEEDFLFDKYATALRCVERFDVVADDVNAMKAYAVTTA